MAAIRNRSEKDAVRWCHLTHQFIVGGISYSREPKTRVAEMYRHFFPKRETHVRVPQCINTSNGHVINDHLQAKNSCVSRALLTHFALRHHQDTSSNQNKIFFSPPDTLAVQLLSSSFCFQLLQAPDIYKFISMHKRNYARCYELICEVLPTGGEACMVHHWQRTN